MQGQLGDDYAAFLASYEQPAAMGLRVNRGYIADEALWALLDVPHVPIPYQAGGYLYQGELGKHPLHQAGAYYLQDPSAMLVANAVDIPRGAWVLDMCAAPGGKSTALAAMIGEEGLLVANEIDLGRAKVLMGNVERLGLNNVVVTSLPPAKVAEFFGAVFDVVVVDAPCSGEGMFRKNPLAVDEWSEYNVTMCADRQKDILDQAALCVKEGGRLVYSTCTFAPQEDEESVRYLVSTGAFEGMASTDRVLAATVCEEEAYCRRFYPHLGAGEGHFVAALRRLTPPDVPPKFAPKRLLRGEEAKAVNAFLEATLASVPSGELCYINNQICLVSADVPLPPYGVLSAGVKLGELVRERKGYRLEPHHMAFKCLPFVNRVALDLFDARLAGYLHGESIAAEARDGFGVLTVAGCPVGGYKAVDGILKNRYPKGLRS